MARFIPTNKHNTLPVVKSNVYLWILLPFDKSLICSLINNWLICYKNWQLFLSVLANIETGRQTDRCINRRTDRQIRLDVSQRYVHNEIWSQLPFLSTSKLKTKQKRFLILLREAPISGWQKRKVKNWNKKNNLFVKLRKRQVL